MLASKSGSVQAHDGVRDPVLERYEVQRATPESPRSQKMCIALVLRSVVNNKKGGFFSLFPFLTLLECSPSPHATFSPVAPISRQFGTHAWPRYWHFNNHPRFKEKENASLLKRPTRNALSLASALNLGTVDPLLVDPHFMSTLMCGTAWS